MQGANLARAVAIELSLSDKLWAVISDDHIILVVEFQWIGVLLVICIQSMSGHVLISVQIGQFTGGNIYPGITSRTVKI